MISATSAGMIPQASQRMMVPTIVMMIPKARTKDADRRCEGIGRTFVRFMSASRSDSYHMLSALAPPEAREVPRMTPRMS